MDGCLQGADISVFSRIEHHQARLAVDGIPFRQSSSHSSVGALNEATSSTLSGYLVTELGPGNHTVQVSDAPPHKKKD